MTAHSRKMKLGLFLLAAGHHVAGWRLPDASSDSEDIHYIHQIVDTAERGKFDFIFLADMPFTSKNNHASMIARLEPITLIAALAALTKHIGLVATASTTYNEPYNVARYFASIDHISKGRVGWNVVTSASSLNAPNFGREKHLSHEQRYDQANEFVEVVKGLWDSWEEGAFLRNKESGEYIDKNKLHTLDYNGEHYAVKGPLNVSRTPQGQPVIVQAGSSTTGQELAARTADVVFTAQQSLDEAKRFYSSIKSKLNDYGRSQNELLVMPGVFTIVGETAEKAQLKYDQLKNMTDLNVGLTTLSELLGHDLSQYDLDAPLPVLPETDDLKSRAKLLTDMANTEGLSLRELAYRVAISRGHHIVVGTPEQIADRLEEWFVNEGADGFNIMPPYFPGGFEDFVNLVIPILQERGIYRTEYEGTLLRDNLELNIPTNRYSS